MDSKNVSSMKSRKMVILSLQAAIISLFLLSTIIPELSFEYAMILYSICNFLSSIHDTAVDGLAVKYLHSATERAYGGFGQYFGYKCGILVPSVLLPLLFGNNYRAATFGASLLMIGVFISTLFFNVSGTVEREESPPVQKVMTSTSFDWLFSILSEKSAIINLFILFIYKFADHGLDFVWGPTLIKEKFSRQVIVKTQFLLGTVAAIGGSMFGTFLSNHLADSSLALAVSSTFRVLPNILQLLFLKVNGLKNERFIGIHALFENFIGSAVTGCMLGYLLDRSNPKFPALSYAFFNSVNLVGMSVGEFTFAQLSGMISITEIIHIGIFVNLLFSLLIFLNSTYRNRSNNNKEI